MSVSDDNGEVSLTAAKTREVKLDMDDFSDVWWNTYRSFMTPQILFEVCAPLDDLSDASLNPSCHSSCGSVTTQRASHSHHPKLRSTM